MEILKSAKRVARVKLALTERTADAREPADRSRIAWDDRLAGFGCCVQPSGVKSLIADCRSSDGDPDEARRKARGKDREALPPDPAGKLGDWTRQLAAVVGWLRQDCGGCRRRIAGRAVAARLNGCCENGTVR